MSKRFEQLAQPCAPQSKWGITFSSPHFFVKQDLACWAEMASGQLQSSHLSLQLVDKTSSCANINRLPWLALHGGPGGSSNSDLVYPLRSNQASWFAFDQRNSGLSASNALDDIDLQRYVDDALALADHLALAQFNVLGGSWGATLAVAIAAYRPMRVGHVILRGPFIPSRRRVTQFFERLQALSPTIYRQYIGEYTCSHQVSDQILSSANDESIIALVQAWRYLENSLLIGQTPRMEWQPEALTEDHQQTLLRRYRLQAHFLRHDCFIDESYWQQCLSRLNDIQGRLVVVQGQDDQICPADGANAIVDQVPNSSLVLVEKAGHLAGDPPIKKALTEAVGSLIRPKC